MNRFYGTIDATNSTVALAVVTANDRIRWTYASRYL
jgi:hypothetical protein